MQFYTDTNHVNVIVDDNVLENVSEFCYLGHNIFNTDDDFTGLRIARATAKFNELSNILRDQDINLSTRRKFLVSLCTLQTNICNTKLEALRRPN